MSMLSMFAVVACLIISTNGAVISLDRHRAKSLGDPHGHGGHESAAVDSYHGDHGDHGSGGVYEGTEPKFMPYMTPGTGGPASSGGHGSGGHSSGGHSSGGHSSSSGGHSSAGGHAEFGDGENHHSEPLNACSVGLAWMLFATVAWVVSLFYFVNSKDDDIRAATWSTLNSMIAIFCGVLLFAATTRTLQDFAGGGFGSHHHGPPPMIHLQISYTRFAVLFLLFQVGMHAFKRSPWSHLYFSGIACHVVGFSAIDCFGETLHLVYFSSEIWWSCVGVALAGVALTALFTMAAKFRDYTTGTHGWKHLSAEMEADSVALALGLLTSMLIRYAITGYLPPVHGAPKGKTDLEVWEIFTSALTVAPLVVLSSVGMHYVEKMDLGNAWMEVLETFQGTIRMTMGWSLLFWGYWCFYNRAESDENYGGKLGQRIVMAVVFSVIVFVFIYGIDKIADQFRGRSSDVAHAIEDGLRALLKTFALLMGLGWEATFAEGVNAVSYVYPEEMRMYVVVTLSLLLCAIVLPAWALYIVPISMGVKKEDKVKGELDKFAAHFLDKLEHHAEHEKQGGYKKKSSIRTKMHDAEEASPRSA